MYKEMNRAGFTLIETMISIGLASVLLLGIATYMNQTAKSTVLRRITSRRDDLVSTIRRVAGNPEALRYSATIAGKNTELKNCIQGAATCNVDQKYQLTLYEPISGNTNPITGPGAANGGAAQPLYYSVQGTLCAGAIQPSDLCPFEVTTTFTYSKTGCTAPGS